MGVRKRRRDSHVAQLVEIAERGTEGSVCREELELRSTAWLGEVEEWAEKQPGRIPRV